MGIKHTFLVLVISGDSKDEVVTVLRLDALCLDTMSETSPSIILAPNVLSLIWQTGQTETRAALVDLYCVYEISVWL